MQLQLPKLFGTSTLMLCLFFSLSCLGQNVSIRGHVTDNSTGFPLQGVTIAHKYSTVLSNEGGEFTLSASKGDKLQISFIGYQGKTLNVGENDVVNISLVPSTTQLNEVVVTALGIRKEKRMVSYSTQEIKGSELIKAREPNAVSGLVGKIAGLTVGPSAEMLGRPQLLLRGSRIDLYVVDGVPINSDTWNLSPDDIESYTVLKGPVASALYGYRGQNGAIVITTKKGSKDKRGFSIEFNSSTMMEKGFVAIPKVQDEYGPGDHGKYAFVDGKGGGTNDGDYDVWGPKFEGQLIPQYDSPVDPITGDRTATPWVARGKNNLTRFIQPGLLTTNNLAISSANERYDLRFSMSHTHQKGIMPNTRLDISNFNINTGYKFSEKLKMDAQLNYNRQYTPNFPDVQYGPNSLIYNIIIWAGADWDINQLKNYWQPGKEGIQSIHAEYQRYHNPWFMVNEWLNGHYKTDVYGYSALTYKFNNNLDVMGRTSITTYDLFRNEKMPFSAHPYGREENLGDYREDKRSLFENNTELMFRYNNKFGIIGMNGFVGGNIRSFNYNSSFVTTDYLNVPGVYSFSNSRNPIKATSFNSDMRVLSAYYSFDFSVSKYLNINTTGRVDKLSTLKPGSNTYFYPSVSANTILSDYLNLPSLISFFKLRTSYANVKSGGGSVSSTIGATPGSAYPLNYGSQYSSSYDGPTYTYQNVYNTGQFYNNQTAASYTNTLIDTDLKPDSRSNIEAGVDMRFLKNRLGLDVTYFNYTDGPQIFNKALSQSTGYNNLILNAVKTRKQGLEISLNGTAVRTRTGFSWDVLANWSMFRERYLELPQGITKLYDFFEVGDRVDKIYIQSFARTPDGQLINDDGGRPIRLPRNQFYGNGDANWAWGLNNRFSYKGVTLSFQFDGRVGGVMENYIRRQTFRGGRHIETARGAIGDARYQDYLGVKSYIGEGVQVSNSSAIEYDPVTGTITNYKDLQFAPNSTPTFVQDYISRYNSTSEGNMMSKTYVKLRETTLTYNIPANLLGRDFIRGASISLVGRNLLYFVKDKRNKDVDIDQYPDRITSSTLQTPTTKRYGVNLNITF